MPPVSMASLLTRKCTDAIRMFAYGVAGNLVDEYLRVSESICLESMYRFCKSVVQVFGPSEPNVEESSCLLSINKSKGFPEMLGSIDWMH